MPSRYLCLLGHRHRNPQPSNECVPYNQHGPLTPSERFWVKVDKTETCWIWLGSRRGKDYSAFPLNNKMVAAHVWAWEQENGPVPDGLELDHLCRTHLCVRPSHLEAVTPRENVLRGESFAAANASKTHCPSGHPYSDENTYIRPDGGRECRRCHLRHSRAYQRKQRGVACQT